MLGTSNKSELLLGYGTQFGDMASALNPIGDLYKTQLYYLAEYLGVPKQILSKAPSGDLWVGQTDEDELGFSYAAVDRLLALMVDRRWQPAQLVRSGFDEAFVDRVVRLVRRNHYKRRLPIIAKLSQRTVDRDFRYARDWGTYSRLLLWKSRASTPFAGWSNAIMSVHASRPETLSALN